MIIRNTKTGACRHVPNPKGGEAVRLLPEEVIEHIGGGEGGNGKSLPAFPFGANSPP